MKYALACILIAASVQPGAAQSYPPQTFTPAVVSGKLSQTGFFTAIYQDCSSRGDIESRIIKKPEHGTVEITPGTGHTNYGQNTQYFHCNEKALPGELVMYKSEDGYTGKDNFTVEFIGPSGGDFTWKYAVTVK